MKTIEICKFSSELLVDGEEDYSYRDMNNSPIVKNLKCRTNELVKLNDVK